MKGPPALAAKAFGAVVFILGFFFIAGATAPGKERAPALAMGCLFVAWAGLIFFSISRTSLHVSSTGLLWKRAFMPSHSWTWNEITSVRIGSTRQPNSLLQVVVEANGKKYRPAILQDFPTKRGEKRLHEIVDLVETYLR